MTKDGRPSRLNDIRLFAGPGSGYLKGFEDQVAFGRRLAWWLNGEGISIGAYTALYVWFLADMDTGQIEWSDQSAMWWFRYARVGVDADFPTADAASLIEAGIVAGLKAAAPTLSGHFDQGAGVVKQYADTLRFLLKVRETRRYIVEVSSTLAAYPGLSSLYVSLHNKETGAYYEAPPAQVDIYADPVYLAGIVRVTGLSAAIAATPSPSSQATVARQGGDLTWSLSDFTPAVRPMTSGLLKF